MKTKIISVISFALFSLMVVNSAFAQKPKSKVLPQVTITSNNAAVSQRVLNNFSKSFNTASNVRWMQFENKYLVKFDQNDMNHNALYRKRGYMLYHVGYGYEKNLPSDVQKMVKSTYKGYHVKRAFLIEQDNRQIWIVNLLGSDNLVSARIESGVMEEISRDRDGSLLASLISMLEVK